MTANGRPEPASSRLLRQYCIRGPKGCLDYSDQGVAVEMARCRTGDCRSEESLEGIAMRVLPS